MDAAEPFLATPSMSRIVDLVAPHLSRDLVPVHALTRIRALTAALPLVSIAGFECHLNSGGRTDFALCFRPPQWERLLLFTNSGAASRMPPASQDISHWACIRAFSERCRDGRLPLRVLDIWLEFDLDEQVHHPPVPSLFFGVNITDDTALDASIAAFAHTLLGQQLSPSVLRGLMRCICRTNTSRGFYLGFLLGRRAQVLRVSLTSAANAATQYLRDVEWPGPIGAVDHIISELNAHLELVTLALDFGPALSPSIGIELLVTPANIDSLLAYLVGHGLCTDAQRAALMHWPGYLEAQNLVIDRRSNHIKLVVRPDEPLEAKAYIGFELQGAC